MKNIINPIIENILNSDINSIKTIDSQLNIKLWSLTKYRSNAYKSCLIYLLPDLKNSTIKKLKKEISDFNVPYKKNYFFFKKIDPNVTIDKLRIMLKKHIKKIPIEQAPKRWRDEIDIINLNILDKKALISECRINIKEAKLRLSSLEKIMEIDLIKTNSIIITQMKAASDVLAKQIISTNYKEIDLEKDINQFPNIHTLHNSTEIENKLWEWFWYEILSPKSTFSKEINSLRLIVQK